jgi:hypothetical protein
MLELRFTKTKQQGKFPLSTTKNRVFHLILSLGIFTPLLANFDLTLSYFIQ